MRNDKGTSRIRELCDYIAAHADEQLTLADLAARAGITSFHLQRTFKAVVGVSPKQYLDDCRMRKFKELLRRGSADGVTGAIYEAGFGASSRLYEKVDTRLGMTPMEYRSGGAGVDIAYAAADTPLGLLLVGASDRGLCFLQFGDEVEGLLNALRAEYPAARVVPMVDPPPAEFRQWMDALNSYLAGQEQDLQLPVHIRATAFQLKVWRYLQSIPAGSVQSYQEVAQGIGQPQAARAVARACASNRVAMVIPCHRVIRGTGELGGYKWGMERKRVLIDLERRGAAMSARG